MKILQLLGNTAFGGATLIVSKIALELRSKGFDVVIMANDEKTKEYFTSLGFICDEIETMGRSIDPNKDLKSVLELRRYVKEHSIDTIHSHTTKGGIYSRALKVIHSKIRVVHTVHGYYLKNDNSRSDKFTLAVERFFHGFADYTTYVNLYDFNVAKKWSKRTINQLIYNGIDCDEFRPVPKDSSNVITIGISARIVHEKGYSEFFDLVEYYANNPNIRFEIVGTGPDYDFYHNRWNEISRTKNVGKDKLIFHGYSTNVKSILESWDINILPSYREGLSISLLEAMAMEIPTVATKIRGNVELIEDEVSGFLYEVKDSQGLIDRVERLINSFELRIKISKATRYRAKNQFDQAKMLELYISIFQSLNDE